MENLIVGALIFFVGLFCHSFLPSYMKKKGENLATHEDINKLVDQTAALTHAAKEIEAKISDRVWGRQRQWEIKKDLLLAVVQSLEIASDRLMHMAGIAYQAGEYRDQQSVSWAHTIHELSLPWSQAIDDYDQKRHIASFVCSGPLGDAMRKTSRSMRESASIVKGKEPFSTSQMFGPIREDIAMVRILAKKELGFTED